MNILDGFPILLRCELLSLAQCSIAHTHHVALLCDESGQARVLISGASLSNNSLEQDVICKGTRHLLLLEGAVAISCLVLDLRLKVPQLLILNQLLQVGGPVGFLSLGHELRRIAKLLHLLPLLRVLVRAQKGVQRLVAWGS